MKTLSSPRSADEGEAVGRVDVDRMGVRPAPAARDWGPCRDGRPTERGRLQAARLVDGQHGGRAAVVVGDEDILARFVDDEVAGPGPLRGLLVEPREPARRLVDGKGDHAAGRLVRRSVETSETA